jgi:hypothetical protein
MDSTVTALAGALMRAVVRSGVVTSAKVDVAIRVMRAELKAFLTEARYADERALALTGGHQLAMKSLVAACIAEIAAA